MPSILCTNCRRPYPADQTPYRCPVCNGTYDFDAPFDFHPDLIEPNLPGMWRYRYTFHLPPEAPIVSLGEGRTPLTWQTAFGRQVAFKQEMLNPSGSYKDRGSAVLVSWLLARGVTSAVEDSSGNAGASFAAYAARAGLQATIYIPEYAAGPKRAQIAAYGAEIVPIQGARSKTAEAVQQAAGAGAVYASHANLPIGLAGYATIAYELYEQMGGAPGSVIVPAGQGNLYLAIGRGFVALQRAGLIERIPQMIGVQALACAPLWAISRYGLNAMGRIQEGETLAEGVRIKHPLHGDAVLSFAAQNDGFFIAVDEPDILPGRDGLARLGFYVEPTSSIVWKALEEVIGEALEPVAVILTGSGLKYQP